MRVVPRRFVAIASGAEVPIETFVDRYPNVNAVAGIGNPLRFARTLREVGVHPTLQAFADHHSFEAGDLEFANDWPVVCTERTP